MSLAAVDLGYAQVKACTGSKQVKFSSVVGNPSVFQLEDEYSKLDSGLGRMEVVYKNNVYITGYGALRYTNNARLTLAQDKANSETNIVKFLAALGALGIQGEVLVVTGIPIYQYNQRASLIDALTGSFEFRYNGQPMCASVSNVKVIPQGGGAYYGLVLEHGAISDRALATSRCSVVDCGSSNTNIITMDKSKYDSGASTTLATGVWQIFGELQRLINEKYQVFYKLAEVEALAKQGFLELYGRRIQIEDMIEKAVEPVAKDIIEGFTAIVGDFRKLTGGIILTGGGACLVAGYFKQEFGYSGIVKIATDPELANVSGYYQYGLLTDGKSNGR